MKYYGCQEKDCEGRCMLEDVIFTDEEIEDYNWYIETYLLTNQPK